MADTKVLGVGSPILDILIQVDDEFVASIDGDKGGMELVSAEQLDAIVAKAAGCKPVSSPGGSAANTIVGLTQLGIATAMLGKLGTDQPGDFYKSGYETIGGDTSRFRYTDETPTGRCLSLVTPDSERTMRTDLGAAAEITVEDIDDSVFSGISHVHMEGYMLFNAPVSQKVLEMAKKHDCCVSLDLASFEVVKVVKDTLPDLLTRYVDIVFANEDEARELCGESDPVKALGLLSAYCDTVAVKVGADGAYIRRGDESVKVDAKLVKAVDTTGAGDLWQAGFIYGVLTGKSLEKAGGFGSILGAEVVQIMGAEIPPERWGMIREELAE